MSSIRRRRFWERSLRLPATSAAAWNWTLSIWTTLRCTRSRDPSSPNYDNLGKGTGETEDSSLISPEKRKEVATELKEEADVLKEAQKAREEAVLQKKRG